MGGSKSGDSGGSGKAAGADRDSSASSAASRSSSTSSSGSSKDAMGPGVSLGSSVGHLGLSDSLGNMRERNRGLMGYSAALSAGMNQTDASNFARSMAQSTAPSLSRSDIAAAAQASRISNAIAAREAVNRSAAQAQAVSTPQSLSASFFGTPPAQVIGAPYSVNLQSLANTPLGEQLAGILSSRAVSTIESPSFNKMAPEQQAGFIDQAMRGGYANIATNAFNESIKENRGMLGKLQDAIFDKAEEGAITKEQLSDLSKMGTPATRAALSGFVSGDIKTNLETGRIQQDKIGRVLGMVGSAPMALAAFTAGPIGSAFGMSQLGSALGKMAAKSALQPGIGFGTVSDLAKGDIAGAVMSSVPFGDTFRELSRVSDIDKAVGLSKSSIRSEVDAAKSKATSTLSMPSALENAYTGVKDVFNKADTFMGDTITGPIKSAGKQVGSTLDSMYESLKNKTLE